MDIVKGIFKRGYTRTFKSKNTIEELKRLILYMGRWQLSTPVLAIVMKLLVNCSYLVAAIISNLIGSLIFYWIDKLIFKPNK